MSEENRVAVNLRLSESSAVCTSGPGDPIGLSSQSASIEGSNGFLQHLLYYLIIILNLKQAIHIYVDKAPLN